MAHYFTDNKDLESDPKDFDYQFENEKFIFTTDNGVFSKKEIDYGSYLLIKTVYKEKLGKTLLDLGSGYGPIGIIIKRFNPSLEVDAVDVNSRATDLNKLNSSRNNTEITVHLCDDIETLNKTFDTITLNPPIRAGKKIIYSLYLKSHAILNDGGSLYIVIRKKQGADTSFRELKGYFKVVEVIARSKGYEVIKASK